MTVTIHGRIRTIANTGIAEPASTAKIVARSTGEVRCQVATMPIGTPTSAVQAVPTAASPRPLIPRMHAGALDRVRARLAAAFP